MIAVQKFTLGYDKLQDRISLTARGPGEEVILLWLTQRLLNRLAQALIRCLDQELETAVSVGSVAECAAGQQHASLLAPQPKNTARERIIPQLHAMEQSAAQSIHRPERPVQALLPVEGFLVTTLQLTQVPKGYLIVCRWADDGAARLAMDSIQLRQFMGMLYRVVVSADWPQQLWPAWFSQEFTLESLPENSIFH